MAGVRATLPWCHQQGHLPRGLPMGHFISHVSGDMVLWLRPVGLAPGFPGLGALLVVPPTRMSWWNRFVIFGHNCAEYWVPIPHSHQDLRALECPGSLFDYGRMGQG